jgi:hypothetical protein
MIVALKVKPQSYDDLALITGLGRRVVSEWLAEFLQRGMVVAAERRLDKRGYLTVKAFSWAY